MEVCVMEVCVTEVCALRNCIDNAIFYRIRIIFEDYLIIKYSRYFHFIFDLSDFYFSVDKFYYFRIKTRQRARKCVFHALATSSD